MHLAKLNVSTSIKLLVPNPQAGRIQEIMKHSKVSKEQPVSVNVERMTTARNMPKHIIPQGLSGDEIRAHILATAKRAEASLEQHEG